MSTRTPEPPSHDEADGMQDDGAVTAAQAAAGETVDYGNNTEPPGDSFQAAEGFGTTPAEVEEGESLDGRLAREVPDLPEGGEEDVRAGQGVGRIVEPDEGARTDTEKELLASDLGTDSGGYSAEESAMHLEPEDQA